MPKKIEITDEQIKMIEQYSALGLSLDSIACLLNISLRTLHRNKEHEILIDTAIKRGRESANAKVSSALFQKAISGNVTAMIFWLKNRAGWRDDQYQIDDKDKEITVRIIDAKL
jgi:hypothetical protein